MYKLLVSCSPQHVFLGWFFTFEPQCYLGYFWYWSFTAVIFLHLCLCSIYLKPLQLLIFMFCYIMPFVDYVKYWKLINLNSYCHKLESQWNELGYVSISFCIHRQLIESLCVCLIVRFLLGNHQASHIQPCSYTRSVFGYVLTPKEGGSKVILVFIFKSYTK